MANFKDLLNKVDTNFKSLGEFVPPHKVRAVKVELKSSDETLKEMRKLKDSMYETAMKLYNRFRQ